MLRNGTTHRKKEKMNANARNCGNPNIKNKMKKSYVQKEKENSDIGMMSLPSDDVKQYL